MSTIFDFVTVGCFLAMAAVFFLLTEREPKTLLNFMLCGIVFAVANQVGNAGQTALAAILIAAGLGYVALLVKR